MKIFDSYDNKRNIFITIIQNLNTCLKNINCIIFLMIFIVVVAQIFLRFTAKYTGIILPWTEDLSRYGLVVMTFIGSSIATLTNENIKISSFRKRLKSSISKYLAIIENLLLLLISIILSYGNFITAKKMIKSPAGALHDSIRIGHIYYIIFFSMLILGLYALFNLYILVKQKSLTKT